MLKILCEECGKEFEAKSKAKRFCSRGCVKKSYYKKYPEKKISIQRRRRNLLKERYANDQVYREKQLAYDKGRTRVRTEYYRSDKYKQRKKKWNQANPHVARISKRRRRVREKNAEGSHTEEQWQAKKLYHGDRCVYCGVEEKDLADKYKIKSLCKLTRDHIKALNNGGSDWISNIVPACLSCNSKK
jgi:hypothetical protein